MHDAVVDRQTAGSIGSSDLANHHPLATKSQEYLGLLSFLLHLLP